MTDRTELPDTLPSARYFGANLSPDQKGVYYSRFTHEGTTVWFHKFGTPASADAKIFGGEYHGEKLGEMALVSAYVTDNQRYLMINISHGVPATREDILVKDLRKLDSPIVPLVYGVEAHTSAENIGDRFFLKTDYQASNSRIVEATPGGEPSAWKTVIPEGKDVIDSDSIVGGRLFVSRLHDVKTDMHHLLARRQTNRTLTYPALGTGLDVFGRPEQSEGFYTFESFITPPSIYRYDTKPAKPEPSSRPKFRSTPRNMKSTRFSITPKTEHASPCSSPEKKDSRATAKPACSDRIRRFDLPVFSEWSPDTPGGCDGGWFALPNLRGGNEYGEHLAQSRHVPDSRTYSTTSMPPPNTSSTNATPHPLASRFPAAPTAAC